MSEKVCESPPPNPFRELSPINGRRVFEYNTVLRVPGANGKAIPMQIWEGIDPFEHIAALLDRCQWFERHAAEVESEVKRLKSRKSSTES